jgi:site-specific DNA recombinase
MSPLRSAIYARVSSEQQTGDGTIASQVAALEARVAQDGQALACRFIDDGYSGALLRRPALERLRDAAAAGDLQRLYVHSPDRLARRYSYQVLLLDEFQRAGVEVVFLNRPLGRSPEDDLLLQIQGVVAEYERAQILERSRRGKRHAARHGVVSVLTDAPYGYRYTGKAAGGGLARYEVVEAEAAVVRQIFHWVGCDRLSIGEVRRRLEQAGHRTRTGRSRWTRGVIWHMLKNPAYKGQAAFGKTRSAPRPVQLRPVRGGSETPRRACRPASVAPEEWIMIPVPAIVAPELFEVVQEQLAENRQRARCGGGGERYLLQGLVVCRLCGYAYCGRRIRRKVSTGQDHHYDYYRCSGGDAWRFGGQRVCSNRQVRTDTLEAAVWREVERLLQDPDRLRAEYQRRLDQVQADCPERPDLASVEGQIAKLRRSLERLIDGYANEIITKDEFEPRIRGFRHRLQDLEDQRRHLADEVAMHRTLSLVIGQLGDFARRVRDRLAQADWHFRRDLIRLLVKRVEIDHNQVNIVFRVAPTFPAPEETIGREGSVLPDCRRGVRAAFPHTAPTSGV